MKENKMKLNTQLDLAARHITAADRYRSKGAPGRAWIHELAARSYLTLASDCLAERLESNPDVLLGRVEA